MRDRVPAIETRVNEDCVVCRTDYRDARNRIARRILCERGYDSACEDCT